MRKYIFLGATLFLILGAGLFLFHRDSASNRTLHITAQELDVKRYIGLDRKEYKEYTGKNVTVAIIDSGVSRHNDINPSRILAFKDFTSKEFNTPYDDYGHGTHIAGIIGANGNYQGIAPNVNFVIAKVMDEDGVTNRDTMIDALEWVLKNKDRYNIEIVNISLGVNPILNYNKDPICIMVKRLKDAGVIVVCSAGNKNDISAQVLSPGISPDVITVGSCKNNNTYEYSDDEAASFSCVGSQTDDYKKPDIVALGIEILTLSYVDPGGYSKVSGTSYSAAITTGVLAVLTEKYREAPQEYIINLIKTSAVKLNGSNDYQQGRGQLSLRSFSE